MTGKLAKVEVTAMSRQRSRLDVIVRGAFDMFIDSKGGWDGDFEPLIATVVERVQGYFIHEMADEFATATKAAITAQLERIVGRR